MPPTGPGSGPVATPGTPSTLFTARTLAGRTLSVPQDFRDRLVLLDFWATWCGPCRAEMPLVRKAHEEFASRGLTIVGVSLDAAQRIPASRVESYVRDHGLPWEQVYEDGPRLAAQFGVAAIPATFLIDGTTGKILAAGDELRGAALHATLARHFQLRNK